VKGRIQHDDAGSGRNFLCAVVPLGVVAMVVVAESSFVGGRRGSLSKKEICDLIVRSARLVMHEGGTRGKNRQEEKLGLLPLKKANLPLTTELLPIKKANLPLTTELLPIKKTNLTLTTELLPNKKQICPSRLNFCPTKSESDPHD
jgi:hypothetical protein